MSEDDKWAKGQKKDGFNEKAEGANEDRETGDGSIPRAIKGDPWR